MKPIWLLDVDGVLNAVAGAPPKSWGDWKTERLNGYWITWSPTMMKRITSLVEADLVEVRWLTTWGRQANQYLCEPFCLPEFVVSAEMDEHDDGYHWWKLPIAQQVFEEGRPLIWTDDDIHFDRSARDWLAYEVEPLERSLVICPRSHQALQPADLDRIEAFCYFWSGKGL